MARARQPSTADALLAMWLSAGAFTYQSATAQIGHDLSKEETLALINAIAAADARGASPAAARRSDSSYWNWETPHVHPIDLTPDHSLLLAVNLPDGVLQVFDVTGAVPTPAGSIPVGVDPVTVRARTNSEAWVVNHISDSISIIDLPTRRVRATISTGDEPCDVIFAGQPERAFVSLGRSNELRVYDPMNLASPPQVIPIAGASPRSLATDGNRVFAAIFESGNDTTLLQEPVVSSDANPYVNDQNPPPNAGAQFDPPINPELPPPPKAGLIVRRQLTDNTWRDDNDGDWTSSVTWGLHDHDLAIVDTSTLSVTYATGLMNANMAIDVGPSGHVTVVGTEATNHLRFEPRLNGTFIRVKLAVVEPSSRSTIRNVDLNSHLTYDSPTISQAERELSIGDPRAIVWNADRSVGWVAGMGSNNVLVIDAEGVPQDRISVGQGPTGLVLDEGRGWLYVLNRFDASISRVSSDTGQEVARFAFHDSTPAVIKAGRPLLYDTHRTSGLGQASCASCHIDGKMDFLAWDLGAPNGEIKTFNQSCNFGTSTRCEDFHPMKGPMTTQTLVGIIGSEPLHWRGDRDDLAEFNSAFTGLLGDDEPLNDEEMQAFSDFIATMRFPPNPNRNVNGSLKTSLPGTGNPANGEILFSTLRIDSGTTTCVACHRMPTGGQGIIISGNLLSEPQSLKIPQLQNMYQKSGFAKDSLFSDRGFGFSHDGGFDTLVSFMHRPDFQFPAGAAGDQQRRDLEAFLLSFSTDTHAAVGQQVTLDSLATATSTQIELLETLEGLAGLGEVELIAKSLVQGSSRGWKFNGDGSWQSDMSSELISTAALRALAAPGSEITFTAVPPGSGTRLGIDRDLDGYLDADEVAANSDPADADSTPFACPGDLDGNGEVDAADISIVLLNFGACTNCAADRDGSGEVDAGDIGTILIDFGPCSRRLMGPPAFLDPSFTSAMPAKESRRLKRDR